MTDGTSPINAEKQLTVPLTAKEHHLFQAGKLVSCHLRIASLSSDACKQRLDASEISAVPLLHLADFDRWEGSEKAGLVISSNAAAKRSGRSVKARPLRMP